MQRFLFLIIGFLFTAHLYAQGQARQVQIVTTVPQCKVAIYDVQGTYLCGGLTPFYADLVSGNTYSYRIRHKYCHADSGYVCVNDSTTQLMVPVRPYTAQIHWKVTPDDAIYTLRKLHSKKETQDGSVRQDMTSLFGKYILSVRRPEYRTYRRLLRIMSDTTIIVDHHLQHCPKHLIIALNGGLAPYASIPLGVTVSYGGVHGAYVRYMQSFNNRADGNDFDNDALIDQLHNPYSDQGAEYLSAIVGYQYLTPIGIYLQGGVGFGRMDFTWQSAADDKRHRYSPDTYKGLALDLGAGYTVGRLYLGASIQSLPASQGGFFSCASLNAGIKL